MEKKNKSKSNILQWTIYDLTIIAMFISLTFLMNYLTTFFPKMPFGGTLGLKYLPVILLFYITGWFKGMIAVLIIATISIVMISQMIVNPWQYILDYVIPMVACSLIVVFKIEVNKVKTLILKTTLALTLIFMIIYLSHVISGVLFFGMYAWKGYDVWVYSLIYNVGFIGATYVIFLVIVPILLKTLKQLKEKYNFY